MIFYDTSSLLNLQQFNSQYYAFSNITLQELEDIKNSNHKDETTKYKARRLLNFMINNWDKCLIYQHNPKNESKLPNGIEINNDAKIISDALVAGSRTTFITGDMAQYALAKSMSMNVQYDRGYKDDSYTGYKEILMTPENYDAISNAYLKPTDNQWDCLLNEYLIFYSADYKVKDILKWDGEKYTPIKYPTVSSDYFGQLQPKDVYQKIALDSFFSNSLTMLSGPPGSGKSQLALEYFCYLLEREEIKKLYIFCNPVATLNASKLGFYPGDKNSKLLDSQMGNVLNSKFGSRTVVEDLIDTEKIVLIPFSDLRGFDSGNKNGIYITEAQNLDITLMKLGVQRIGDDCITIVEGDYKRQTDSHYYDGMLNGMRRLSEVFRGTAPFGQVEFQNIYRSQIAQIGERM